MDRVKKTRSSLGRRVPAGGPGPGRPAVVLDRFARDEESAR